MRSWSRYRVTGVIPCARYGAPLLGPSYTLGIEEELAIVDEETLDLSNSIERLLDDLRDMPTDGEVKPG